MAKRRAAELGISFAEFARRLFEKELATVMPQGDIDSICGMVEGTPFDMSRRRKRRSSKKLQPTVCSKVVASPDYSCFPPHLRTSGHLNVMICGSATVHRG